MKNRKKRRIICIGFAVLVLILVLFFFWKKYADHSWNMGGQKEAGAITGSFSESEKFAENVYMQEGFLSKVEYPENKKAWDRAIARFRYIKDQYLTEEHRIFLSIIPDKNCFLAAQSGQPVMDYEILESYFADGADFAEYIKISDLLEKEDYYKTDTHWRQEKITDVAQRLARDMDITLSEDYEEHILEQEFYGSYYDKWFLPIQADTIHYLTNDAMEHCVVYDHQNRKPGTLYDFEQAAKGNAYDVFLSGPISLLTIENPLGPKGKELIVFRDSFGSSIAPLLISGYSKITLVDIRYIRPEILTNFIDFKACDVLFLYSTLVLNNPAAIK